MCNYMFQFFKVQIKCCFCHVLFQQCCFFYSPTSYLKGAYSAHTKAKLLNSFGGHQKLRMSFKAYLLPNQPRSLQQSSWVSIFSTVNKTSFTLVILRAARLILSHSIYIRTVNFYGLLSIFLIQFKLDYGSFGQSNMHSMLDFCTRPARKEINVPLHQIS